MGQPNSQHTADELLAIHARLTELEAERQRLLRRKRILQQRQAKFITPSLASSNQLGAAQKVALFRDLFKGRSDVFARRWENPGKGRSGYAVACHNEWRHGLCNKPKIKCGECQNRRYQPPDERAIHATPT
uniref:TOTE conflict system primase domain-containing protein n=1 Tax=Candidatus Kentrum sp. TUN TaxID=2126343 RepID=A0A451A813_9GAMM|nr:MAG: hypothetical protein BECKTUN1418D_GA0071000_11693 [Candidatus Kentron sp. TUN]